MLCYDFHTLKKKDSKSWADTTELTAPNYFYHMLSELVKNQMGSFNVSAEGRKGNPELQTSNFPNHTFKTRQPVLERVRVA